MTYSFYRFLPSDAFLWIGIPYIVVCIALFFLLLRIRSLGKPNRLPLGLFVFAIFTILLSPIWVATIWVLGLELYGVAIDVPPEDWDDRRWRSLSIVGLVTALGALVSAPLAIIRVFTTERQTKTAEDRRNHDDQVLVNQRIQGALEQLSARYIRTRIGRTIEHGRIPKDGGPRRHKLLQWYDEGTNVPKGLVKPSVGNWEAVQFSEQDIQTRLSGIGQLEAVAKETNGRGLAINQHLANFIRANAPASIARAQPKKSASESTLENIARQQAWANTLSVQADIQAALSLICRSEMKALTAHIDLRQTCLQAAEIIGKHLSHADLRGARIEGADLSGANLRGAKLAAAQMVGTKFWKADLGQADLGTANLSAANLCDANMMKANLVGVNLEGALLINASLKGADIWRSNLDMTDLNGADLREADMEEAQLHSASFEGTLLNGTNLVSANINRAKFFESSFDVYTDFSDAVLRHATVKSSNFSMVNLDQAQINSMFGDGTMTADMLPENISRPAHWPQIGLDWVEVDGEPVNRLLHERDKWAADPENYVPPTE